MNEVIDLLLSLVEDISRDADNMSDEEFDESMMFILEAVEVIRQQEEETPAIPANDNTLAPHESSQINGFDYDPETGKLQVQFHGKYPQAAGSQYEYDDVPPWVFDLFQRGAIAPKTSGSNRWHRWEKGKTPSHGAAMNALIKAGGFNYRKVA